ncbi:hypothetical protein E3N88_40592 [Mikania micrantha]|uniref:Retrotransposon gag domain-containing protein n=1 Tax=Mikania micrantha TaxID=192012 RepID=A0A5N6LN58_9ASTR|nr:hypothetical protein E3N88_40592 [Mikania micrantha]
MARKGEKRVNYKLQDSTQLEMVMGMSLTGGWNEIRDPYDRLEVQEQQIQQLQADVNEIKTTLHSLEVERGEYVEFRKIILAWMKHYEQQQIDRSSGTSNSSGLFSPSNSNFDSIQVPMGVPKAVTQLQLPEFNGIDPHGWLQQANLYFDFNNTPDELRLHLIQFRMVGVAHHWFTALTQIWESITWLEFQSELLQRFNGFEIPTPYEQSDSIHASVIDFVAGKEVESVVDPPVDPLFDPVFEPTGFALSSVWLLSVAATLRRKTRQTVQPASRLGTIGELGTAVVFDDGRSWAPLAVGGDVFIRTVGGDQRRSPVAVVTWCAGWKWWQRCDGERQELVAKLRWGIGDSVW